MKREPSEMLKGSSVIDYSSISPGGEGGGASNTNFSRKL